MNWRKWTAGVLAAAVTFSAALPGGITARAAEPEDGYTAADDTYKAPVPLALESRESAKNLASGLVLYCTFDDAYRTGTTIQDQSGNGHNGTAVGGLTFDVGKSGQAVKITGQTDAGTDIKDNNSTNPGDRYINFGDSSAIIPATGDFSVSFWFKSVGTATTNVSLLGNKNYASAGNQGFVVGIVSNELCFNMSDGSGAIEMAPGKPAGQGKYPLMTGKTKDETWHHLVCTYDRDGNMVGYVDGQEAGKISISSKKASITPADMNLVFGAGGNFFNAANNCILDELLIYDRLLSVEEIGQLYNLVEPDFEPPTLDEDILLNVNFDGGNAADASGNGYNGTVTGEGVTFVDGLGGGRAVRIYNKDAAVGNANDNAVADSYVDFGEAISRDGMADKSLTMSFWYKPDPEMNSYGAIISNKDYGSGSNKGFALGYYGGDDCKMNFVPAGAGSSDRIQVSGINLNQNGGWHHFSASVEAGKLLTVYVDGQLAGTKALPSGTIHANYPLILGAGGNLKNPITNVQIDNLLIYGRALTAAEVDQLYQRDADSVAADRAATRIAEMRAVVTATTPGVLYPQASIDAMLQKLDAAQERLAGGMTPTEIEAMMAELEAAYQAFLPGLKPLASFHMISDVHFSDNSTTNATHKANYIKGLENMADVNKDTTIAFVNAGDFTTNSTAAEYQDFYDTTKANNPFTNDQTLVLLGNHDVRGPAGNNKENWNVDPRTPDKCVNWPASKALYQQYNADYMPASAQDTLYHVKELGGYTFLMLNTELGLKDAMYMSDAQLAWFEETMKAAYKADPSKPVFIISHQALNDTHWRSNTLNGFDGVQTDGTGYDYQTGMDAKVKEIMAKYPNGVFLSGHIHNGLGVAEVVMREYGVTVEVPSFNESENGVTAAGTGYEVQIYDGFLAFRGYNYITNEWLPEYDVIVTVGENSAAATAQRARTVLDDPLYYSKEDVSKVRAAAGPLLGLLNRLYNQSGLPWDHKDPPTEYFYHADDHAAIEAAIPAVDPALEGVVRLEEPRATEFAELREAWRAYLLGGTGDDLDLNDPAVQLYLDGLNTDSINYWNSMIKSNDKTRVNLWSDLDMSPLNGGSPNATITGNMANTLSRLRTLALAWATEGCDFYQSEPILSEIIKGTDFVVGTYYKLDKYAAKKAPGNWYHWEISAPTALGNIAMVLYDQLGEERVELYARTMQHYAPYCDKGGPITPQGDLTAANCLLKANGVAQAGVLLEDASMLENVSTVAKGIVSHYNDPDLLFSTGNPGDGFYADGSYIQHQALPYIAGYGADLYNNFSIFSIILKGSQWEIIFAPGEDPVIYDLVFSGIEPFIYETRIMDMVTGRGITRNGYTDKGKTADIISALIPMRGTFPTEEQNQRFDSMMKYYLSLDPERYFSQISSIYSIKAASELLSDPTIQPRSNYALTKTFAMDRTVHITPEFGLGIAMQSTRIFAHETINSEGKRTWNIANGMVFLYDADEDQYGGGYWASVDPTRLPGTTAEHVVLANARGSLNTNIYDWTGGSSIGSNGVAGMHMRALSRNDNPPERAVGPRTGADMKKSYFMFGDRILMLGSGITSDTGDNVETIVDNRKILLDGSNTVTVDGAEAALSTDPAAPTALENPAWMHLQGSVAGADIGYYFPEEIHIQAMKDTRTGNWQDQGTTSGTATNTFATFYVDHGKNPTDAGYAYMLLPGRSAAETAAYAAAPDVEILRNDTSVHAARDNANGIVAANFWEAGDVAGITVDKPASVILERKGDVVTLGVSDPTQRDVAIGVSLALGGEILSCDGAVTVEQSEPFIRLSVDTTEGLGGTFTVSFRAAETDREIISVKTVFAPIQAEQGVPFNDLPLPYTATFLANDMEEYELGIEWDRGGYDPDVYGVYHLTGTPILTDGLLNTAGLTVEITVELGEYRFLAAEDTFVWDNGDPSGFDKPELVVKNDGAGFRRKALFRFDLTALPEDFSSAVFEFRARCGVDFQEAELYQIGNGWDQRTVTFDTVPAHTSTDPVAALTRQDVQEVVRLDVTDAVRAALDAGETELSFVLEALGTPGSYNDLYILSLENADPVKPSLNLTGTASSAAADKTNLRFLVNLVGELDQTAFQNYDRDAMDLALGTARTVLDDAGATQAQVNSAEDGVLSVLLGLRLIPIPTV